LNKLKLNAQFDGYNSSENDLDGSYTVINNRNANQIIQSSLNNSYLFYFYLRKFISIIYNT